MHGPNTCSVLTQRVVVWRGMARTQYTLHYKQRETGETTHQFPIKVLSRSPINAPNSMANNNALNCQLRVSIFGSLADGVLIAIGIVLRISVVWDAAIDAHNERSSGMLFWVSEQVDLPGVRIDWGDGGRHFGHKNTK